MTLSEFVGVDEFVEVDNSGLMSTICRTLESVGLQVVHGGDGDVRPGERANGQPQGVLLGNEPGGWHGAGTVAFRQGRGAGAPVVLVAMYRDEAAAFAAMATGATEEGTGSSVLTAREVEVLQALANGAPINDVAASLFISHKTVKNHLAHIYAKLGASSRTQAVAAAVRLGIVRIA